MLFRSYPCNSDNRRDFHSRTCNKKASSQAPHFSRERFRNNEDAGDLEIAGWADYMAEMNIQAEDEGRDRPYP